MTATITDPRHAAVADLGTETLAELRAALTSEREIQEVVAAERDATVVELTGNPDVDSILEREVAEASAARARDAIENIDAALARMAAGTYGRCESCGESLPVERLEAIPHARFCVACAAGR
jgi:RNA polymerase-binding transcription factor DksA